MKIEELNSENISDYREIIDSDVAESIGREFYHGIVAVEGAAPSGALIWEYKNLEDTADTNAEIYFAGAESDEAVKSLLNEFDELTASNDVVRAFFDLRILSDDLVKGFKEKGFEVTDGESRDLQITVSDLKPLMALKKKLGDNIVGLDSLMSLQFIRGVTNCLFRGKKGLVEDLEYVEKDWFDESVSSCTITDGKVSGMLLVHRFPSGVLMPVLFNAIGPDSKIDLLSMIAFTARKAVANYSESTPVVIRRHNAMVSALSKKLFGDRPVGQAVHGSRG